MSPTTDRDLADELRLDPTELLVQLDTAREVELAFSP